MIRNGMEIQKNIDIITENYYLNLNIKMEKFGILKVLMKTQMKIMN